jgi:nucleoside 2-deoxyribosyltransferase
VHVVLSGSMRFLEAMCEVGRALEARGHTVVLPEPTPTGIDPQRLRGEALVAFKAAFVAAHLRAIRAADAVLVVNVDAPEARGYVGPSALVELAFAVALGKRAYVLHDVGEQPNRLEVLALRPTLLAGDVGALA